MTTIRLRRDTSANWASADPVLAAGEPGYDTTTGMLKVGNGTDSWSELPAIEGGGAAVDLRPPALALGADWCIDANMAVGTAVWPDQGRSGVDVPNVDGGAAPVPAGAWTGTRVIGGLSTLVDDWPTLLDVRWSGRMLQKAVPSGIYSELFVATIDSDEDYLEPAYVQHPNGVGFGIDLRLAGEDSERQWQPTYRLPAGTEWDDHLGRITMDGTVLRLYIDGVLVESADVEDVPMRETGSETSAPYTLAEVPDGTRLSAAINTVALSWAEIRSGIDGAVLYRIDASNAADGAATVTTSGRTWGNLNDLGIVTGPFTERRFIRGFSPGYQVDDDALLDIDADTSMTWAWRGRAWPRATIGSVLWSRADLMGFAGGGGEAGWLIGQIAPLSMTYGMIIGSAGPEVMVTASARPTGDHVAVVVLDRAAEELRLYIDGILEDTADASGLGAVAPARPLNVLGAGGGDLSWLALWRRPLDPDEIAFLTPT